MSPTRRQLLAATPLVFLPKQQEQETEDTLLKYITPKIAYCIVEEQNQTIPELEHIIAQDAQYSCWYAIHVLKERFPEGEAAIAQDAACSYSYAIIFLQGRFPEGEGVIATSTEYSYCYARNVLKERFLEGEPEIAQNAVYSSWYVQNIINNPQQYLKEII